MIWTLMLFAVGLCGALGFYDRVFGFSDQMRYINSGILVMLSMGLLVRTLILTRIGKVEKLTERIAELERLTEQSGLGKREEKREMAASHSG
jgi:hypothetical protein